MTIVWTFRDCRLIIKQFYFIPAIELAFALTRGRTARKRRHLLLLVKRSQQDSKMHPLPDTPPLHVERNPLGTFTFFSNYAIAEWHNPEIDSFELFKMETVARSVYGDADWGYISNRTHATVSNPIAIIQLLRGSCAPKAVAIVTYSLRSQLVARLEKEHCKEVPLEIFNHLDKAEQWIRTQMEKLELDSLETASSSRLA
jgi:hypothetical protein